MREKICASLLCGLLLCAGLSAADQFGFGNLEEDDFPMTTKEIPQMAIQKKLTDRRERARSLSSRKWSGSSFTELESESKQSASDFIESWERHHFFNLQQKELLLTLFAMMHCENNPQMKTNRYEEKSTTTVFTLLTAILEEEEEKSVFESQFNVALVKLYEPAELLHMIPLDNFIKIMWDARHRKIDTRMIELIARFNQLIFKQIKESFKY